MTGDIPDVLKPELNEFIRIGKRYWLQNHYLKKKAIENVISAQDRIFKVLKETKTNHFEFIILPDNAFNPLYSCPHLVIYLGPEHQTCHVALDRSLIEGKFSDAFFYIPTSIEAMCKGTIYNPALIIEEFNTLLIDLKKKIAFDFFQWVKYKRYLNKILTLLTRKNARLMNLIHTVNAIWYTSAVPLLKGTKINYYADVNKLREVTFEKAYPDGTLEITLPSGNTLITLSENCTWKDEFKKSELYKKMTTLLTTEIPEEWKENRLEFYS